MCARLRLPASDRPLDPLGDCLSASQLRVIAGLAFALGAIALLRFFRHASVGMILLAISVYLGALMVTIAFLLEYPQLRRHPRTSEAAAELEKRDLLVATRFRAERAFRVAELHHEGPHYFLELENGSILHLSGPYLYAYEPGPDSLRHFPCSVFTVRRHAQLGQVVDLLCEGVVIEPEVEAPAYTPRDFARGHPADGEILRHLTFDQLLRQRTAVPPHVS
jgi:hypothetical protein